MKKSAPTHMKNAIMRKHSFRTPYFIYNQQWQGRYRNGFFRHPDALGKLLYHSIVKKPVI